MAGSLWYDGELEAQESAMPLDDQITGQNNVYSRMEHEAGALNCWAPEIIYDKSIDGYMIFWATTIPGRFESGETTGDDKYNHRLYYTITKDFKAFSPTQLLYDEGFNVIDATIVKKDDKYLSFLTEKQETGKKSTSALQRATHCPRIYTDQHAHNARLGEGPGLKNRDYWVVF